MLHFLFLSSYLRGILRSRHDLGLEVLALRQQLAVLKRKNPRPHLRPIDRLFWVSLSTLWTRWSDALILVKPDTVFGWHRAGFRFYWRLRIRFGRRKLDSAVLDALRQMAAENPSWGAPRTHGELVKLGYTISERTVSRYLARGTLRPSHSGGQWLTFLNNHREAIAAIDFFTVPTLSFRLLYCFFVIDHHRRRILHFNVTAHPTASWVCQQLREAFPNPTGDRYLILDRDSKFSTQVLELVESSGMKPKRTSIRSPWQNGVAERWIGSARRECFDHVIALNEAHVRRIGREYIAYYHDDRTHLALAKDAPSPRPVEAQPGNQGTPHYVASVPNRSTKIRASPS
jgi:putative transposase